MRFSSYLGAVVLVCALVLAGVDVAIRLAFPSFPRFQDNFSWAYLNRSLQPGTLNGSIVFLGDSVLWGYGLPPDEIASTLLRERGARVNNLAFQGGSMANTYAMLRAMVSRGIRSGLILFNVNLKSFSGEDSAYSTLYPALQRLIWPALDESDRALLSPPSLPSRDSRISDDLDSVWALYGLRSDLREMLWNHADAISALDDAIGAASGRNERVAEAHQPTADRFLGTYNLAPLTENNVEVVFLRKTVALIHANHLRAIAVLTPTNHRLLHDYIDVPEYDAQLRFVSSALHPFVKVINYDREFNANEFIDNDHLNREGNQRLAKLLAPMVLQ